MAKQSISSNNGPVSRIRGASISLINANPQLGVWQAAGTAIAQAPTLGELRDSESGGTNIAFNAQGHSARFAVQEPDGELALATSNAKRPIFSTSIFNEVLVDTIESPTEAITRGAPVRPLEEDRRHGHHRRRSLYERHKGDAKERWKMTLSHGLNAFWKFFKTPSGFLISIYFLNIVVSSEALIAET